MSALSAEPIALALPALRLVPAPTSAPPYDDEDRGTPILRLVRPTGACTSPVPFDDEAWAAAERSATSTLPSSTTFARTLIQGLLEVVAGVRSVKQLQRDTTPELYLKLAESLHLTPRPQGARPDRRAVKSLHCQERPEGVVEVCATVQRGDRYGALALRLEGLDGRWRCTALQMG